MIYTAVFTPYVAAFLLNDTDYKNTQALGYTGDPIVIIDLLGRDTSTMRNNCRFLHVFK